MFKKLFKDKAAKPEPALTLDYIRTVTLAGTDNGWTDRVPLLNRCITAFEAGQPEYLAMFLGSYLEFKRAEGYLDKIEKNGLDAGLVGLVADPVMLLLERQMDPAAAVATMATSMSPFYRQYLLDIVLRRACHRNSWMIVEPLIDAGANVDTGRGRPLYSALCTGYQSVATMLIMRGADPRLPAGLASSAADANKITLGLDSLLKKMVETRKKDAGAEPTSTDAPLKITKKITQKPLPPTV